MSGKSLGFALCLFFFCLSLNAGIASEWFAHYGSGGNDEATSSCFDSAGNFYVGGTFTGTMPISGVTLNSAIHTAIFIAKYSSTGQLLWAKQSSAAGTTPRVANLAGIAVDSQQNVYFCGNFRYSFKLESYTFNTTGNSDSFIAKLNSSGSFLWLQQGSNVGDDAATGICLGSDDQPVICGYHNSTTSLFNLPVTGFGVEDIYAVKLSDSGVVQAFSYWGSSGSDKPRKICSLATGGYAFCGQNNGEISFGSSTLPAHAGEAFVCSLDSTLNALWAKGTIGTAFLQDATALAADSSSIYVFGKYSGQTSFDSIPLPDLDNAVFGVKLSMSGSVSVASTICVSTTSIRNITSASCQQNKLYLTGNFSGTLSFATSSLSSAGYTDALLMCLCADISPLWAESFGGDGDDNAYSICGYTDGKKLIAGSFTGSASIATNTATSNGLKDVYALLFSEQNASNPAAPLHANIRKVGSTLRLSWDAVSTSETGAPMSISGYNIYYSSNPTGEDFQLLGQCDSTTYDLSGTEILPELRFFRITAYR
jgi:hypothetical protein